MAPFGWDDTVPDKIEHTAHESIERGEVRALVGDVTQIELLRPQERIYKISMDHERDDLI